MAPLFGPSESDLEHLRSTVRALGAATVPGISAALSWRDHKTEKLLAHELAQPNSPLVYDPARRTVRWVAPAPAATPVDPTVPAGGRTVSAPPPAPTAPAPSFAPGGLKIRCPHCRVPLLSTGSSGLLVCPQCGRLSSTPRSPAAPSPSVPTGPAGAPPPSGDRPTLPTSSTSGAAAVPAPRPAPPSSAPAPAAGPTTPDRRSQEMFAAWVTNQPIPCPKCRTPLRHRGVRVYACPACGQQVRFPDSGGGPSREAGTPIAPPAR
jgi:ribosomal protein L37AE/L43A